MIHISLEGRTPPAEWLERAREATAVLEAAATREERERIIDANAAVWRDLKAWLLDISHGKCWYSEAQDAFSHGDVEHFRPKRTAKNMDGTTREGYWWLAFAWTNFRICGNVGNTSKGTFFPLRAGSFVASSTDRHIEDEVCYMLDPTRAGDPALLSFNEEGEAIPVPGLGGWQRERAVVTIRLLKLCHEPLADLRRQKWMQCRDEIDACQRLMKRLEDGAGAAAQTELDMRLRGLMQMIRPTEPLSAVARECLAASGLRWASRVAVGL
jgi:uncharacterized protein (TIGR02646 family)